MLTAVLKNAILLLLAVTFLVCGEAPRYDLAVVGVSIVDVEDGTIRFNQTILIQAGRISKITPASSRDSETSLKHVNGEGLFAIPGLWDMHVHALWDSSAAVSFLKSFAKNGVTGIVDMGGDLSVLDQVRNAPDSVNWQWPRLYAAGQILDGPEPVDPTISIAINSAAEGIEAVDQLVDLGADLIKVYTLLPREAYFAILDRAGVLGIRVVGHVPAAVSVAEAIHEGQTGIEHLRDEIEPFCHELDPAECSELISEFRELGVHNTPTLVVLNAKGIPGYRVPASIVVEDDLPEVVKHFWNSSRESHVLHTSEYFSHRRTIFDEELKLVGKLYNEGAAILAGSDTGNPFIYPGISLHRELELLVEAGLTPRDALRAATLSPADFLGIADSVGALREGFVADIVLLGGNPLENISNVRDIAAVVLKGRMLDVLVPMPLSINP